MKGDLTEPAPPRTQQRFNTLMWQVIEREPDPLLRLSIYLYFMALKETRSRSDKVRVCAWQWLRASDLASNIGETMRIDQWR